MELVNVYVVCLQVFKAGFQILPEAFSVLRTCLCADNKLVACVLKCLAQLYLTVGVGSCCVKVVDAIVKSLLQQILFLRATNTKTKQSGRGNGAEKYVTKAERGAGVGLAKQRRRK